MKRAETVTFGGSALDRAAPLRPDVEGQAKLWAHEAATVLPLWRGKLLAEAGRPLALRVAEAEVLAEAPRLFLGLAEGGEPLFAADLPDWEGAEAPGSGFSDETEQRHPALPRGAFAELRRMMPALAPREAELAATARALFEWHRTHRFCARCGAESLPELGGWQRHCPACGARHFPRTDPVVIMLVTRGNSVLLGRAPAWPEGMFSLLAGFIEPGEGVEAAVRREVFEETGVRVGEVSYLASQPWPFPASLMLGCIGGAVSEEITLDPVEIEEAVWVSRERLAEIFAGRDAVIRPAREGAIAHFLLWHWLADRLD
ncbi:NAD(+) diphosphatase [Pseudoroseicyclus tamaricis]|uniref:NAD(+) diphosphatase n=1 Tax=Pseudoroseicyclus tamaricis TaxID=2705421 RepID=A0A6B2JF58_9RHOB|nr:NAD(+) diphosphatase [Pseudoroseicyclus tamaricis]NDU99620.1 NAD(+) diphosphatase [Pseudoroseicyclus tamaricis]